MSQSEQPRALALHGASPLPENDHDGGDGLDLKEYLAIFQRRRWLVLGTLLLVLVLGMLYTVLQRPVYEATAKILVTANAPSSHADDISVLSDLQALTQGRSVETQVEIVSSPDLLDDAFHDLDPRLRERGFSGQTLPPWSVEISAKKNTDIITITVRSYSPAASSVLANGIARAYFSRDLEQSSQATRQVRRYVDSSLNQVRHNLSKANAALAAFKKRTGMIAPDAQLTRMAESLAGLQEYMDRANTDYSAAERSVRVTRGQLAAMQAEVLASSTVTQNPRFVAEMQKLDNLHAQRAALLQEFLPDAPEVQMLDGRIKDEETRLKQISDTLVSAQTRTRNPVHDGLMKTYADSVAMAAATQARITSLTGALHARRGEAGQLPDRERQLTELMQQVAVLKGTYDTLMEKNQALRITEQATLPNGRLVAHARAASIPLRPRPVHNAVLFFLLGSIAAVVLAMVVERLDDHVRNPEMAEQITASSTMTAVPKMRADEPHLISQVGRHSPLLESFRILRNNISFAALDRPLRILAVSSSGPGEGKSTVTANLAMAMAMDGKRVLVVDCDLRRPSMHTLMGVPRDVGFTNVVTGACSLEKAIVATGVEGLSFLPTGPLPPNPTEVLNSQAGRKLIAQLAEMYDVVLVDCPPCLGLGDVQVIATLVDGLLLVVCANQTVKTRLHLAVRALAQAGAPLIGLILNRLDLRQHAYGYYYYYYAESEAAPGEKKKKKHPRKAA